MNPRRASFGLAGLLLGSVGLLHGCSGKGWDQEIVLQLFKPRAVPCDKVIIEADQGSTKKALEVPSPFVSCSSNLVRIIPREVDGKYPPVHIVARCGVGLLKAELTVPVPAPKSPVPVAIGPGPEFDPSGCGPSSMPDMGPVVKRKLAEPCTNKDECEGGVCLTKIETPQPTVFPEGYCSADCSKTDCGVIGLCQTFQNGLAQDIGSYCLKRCVGDAQCPGARLYCTPAGNTCMPRP